MSTIKTDNEDLVLHAEGAKDVEIQTNGSTKLTVKSDGKIGIGTASPVAKFDVRGTISTNNGYFFHNKKSCTYQYAQQSTGNSVQHIILAPDGSDWKTYFAANVSAEIMISVSGTGTDNASCRYHYSSTYNRKGDLQHLSGNSAASSNRPYMGITTTGNEANPYWVMAHGNPYVVSVLVTTSTVY